MQGIIPIQSKFHFVNIYNWYANATICMSTIVSIGFVFMISFYDECFYNLKIALNNYKAFGILENESVLGFVNDSLTNFQHTSMLLKCCYLFTFIILLAFLIVMFYAMRIAKPIIFTVDINRSTQDICDTIKPDGISIVKQNSEIITLDLLNQKLTFLFDAVVIFDYSCKDLIVFRNNVIQKIVVKEVSNCRQIIYNSNLKKWVVR